MKSVDEYVQGTFNAYYLFTYVLYRDKTDHDSLQHWFYWNRIVPANLEESYLVKEFMVDH